MLRDQGYAHFCSQIKQICVFSHLLEVVDGGSETQLKVGKNLHQITYTALF